MIALSASTALIFYFGITLVTLLGMWIISHYRNRYRTFMPLEKELIVCEFCHFAYLDNGNQKITQCTRCESYNRSENE